MNTKNLHWAVMVAALMIGGCGGGDSLLGTDKDVDPLRPEAGTIDPADRPRPPEAEPTMTTTERFVLDVTGERALLRGATLDYQSAPAEMIEAVEPMAALGANAVRLMVSPETTATELEAALSQIAENNMVAVITLTDDGSRVRCVESPDFLLGAVDDLWLGEWLEVIVQDRFQGRMIINVADGWGPQGIFNSASLGYAEYIDTYKALIRKFRNAGFKVPLMIDAPSCGQDYNAFLAGRGRELMAADDEENLIFAANGEGFRWDNADKVISANTLLAEQEVPFVMNAFAGSGTGSFPVDEGVFMAQARGDAAVSLDTPWASAEDGVGYVNAFGDTLDLTGGAASLDVFMDRRYLEFMRVSPGSSNYAPNGTTGIAMYLVDAEGNRLRLGMSLARELRENTWNKLRFDVPEEIDPANLMGDATGFDKEAVTHVGVEILANGKSEAAEGEIKFDNMNIFPGVPPMFTSEFNADGDAEQWMVDGADSWVADGSLQALPTADQINFQMAAWNGDAIGQIDFSKTLNVSVRIFLPEEYAGDQAGMWMNAFGQFGEGWSWNSISVSPSQLIPGEWAELKYTINFNETVEPASDIHIAQAFGLQIGGVSTPKSEPILIDAITIHDQDARPTKIVTSTQYKATFSSGVEGFQTNWGAQAAVSSENEELVIDMPEGDGGVVNKSDVNSVAEISFGGDLTVKARLFLPESFSGSDFWLTFFFQDGSWNHMVVGTVDIESFNFGEWNDLEFSVTDEVYATATNSSGEVVGFSRTLSPNMFGVHYAANSAPAGEIRLDDLEIIGDTEVDDLQPIYEQGFETAGAIEELEVDFTSGVLDAGSMLTAKSQGWHVVPFGWTASTWFNSDALSLSEQADEAVLTARGEIIVNGPGGIAETSGPVMFE